ncbi:MAG: SDR family NAD(P)-dependent oxidoreductase [Alphaproteobacteria bacterium]|nr:SDR family NAD(P)-dependent oxidoreductase [Alphaproteobacteria bacterium]MBU1281228.1 SDR family NAD(P)-dependent oxidoreductase [Alphaproteobacteria bacterium]MBU1575567.1 SDR family NAD(P)-dependent oxidoreductase [Alphaproteobacteria bacterium]MBU1829695.1 SDR family NAD(P)-dependent oxidoreductase [Alphaproteobacteria bacterium]MBU2076662.1 SDR family NAD(P)-dependent oxidoreductase [Alphaproteobacteria bacterium]
MTNPLTPPKRKDPLLRTHVGHVSPNLRSRAATAMAARAGPGRFVLQVCHDCRRATYPPRDRCPVCWGELDWQDQPRGAVIEAETTVRSSVDLFFRDHLPWRIGSARLDAGPMAIVHLHGDVKQGDRVRMELKLDRGGNPALFALPEKETSHMADDPQLRLFTANPKVRRILVTDGREATGQAVASALLDAGATTVFLGNADPLMRYPGQDRIEAIDGIEPVALNLTDTGSIEKLAAQLGGRVDIVVNTARFTRSGGVGFGGKLSDLQSSLDLEVTGLMRLAQAFAPALSARSDDGVNAAAAFVDVASIHGLTGNAGFAGSSAAAAARLALVASLRGEMAQTGIRVMSVLTGPVDDSWHQSVPPPKVTPTQIARAVVTALQSGQETICADDVAQDVMTRWQADPALTIREENK